MNGWIIKQNKEVYKLSLSLNYRKLKTKESWYKLTSWFLLHTTIQNAPALTWRVGSYTLCMLRCCILNHSTFTTTFRSLVSACSHTVYHTGSQLHCYMLNFKIWNCIQIPHLITHSYNWVINMFLTVCF